MQCPTTSPLGLANKQVNKLRGFRVCLDYLDIMWVNYCSWRFSCLVAAVFYALFLRDKNWSFYKTKLYSNPELHVWCAIFNENMFTLWSCFTKADCPLWSIPHNATVNEMKIYVSFLQRPIHSDLKNQVLILKQSFEVVRVKCPCFSKMVGPCKDRRTKMCMCLCVCAQIWLV